MPKGIPKNGINKGWFKRKKRIIFICKSCECEFADHKKRVFCSLKCLLEWRRNNPSWNKGIPNTWSVGFEKGHISWNKGLKWLAMRGGNSPNWKGGKPKCEVCGKQLSEYSSKKCWKCHSTSIKRENHWNWKGGKTDGTEAIKQSLEYKTWRNKVHKRDYWTCQFCGYRGKQIITHHIKPFADFPELRLDINNGMTLCRKCHLEIHKKDFRSKTK